LSRIGTSSHLKGTEENSEKLKLNDLLNMYDDNTHYESITSAELTLFVTGPDVIRSTGLTRMHR
jgi:hypothetical protein